MKRVHKQQVKDNQAVKLIMRQLFEMQIELREFNEKQHDYDEEFQVIIEILDALFEKVMED